MLYQSNMEISRQRLNRNGTIIWCALDKCPGWKVRTIGSLNSQHTHQTIPATTTVSNNGQESRKLRIGVDLKVNGVGLKSLRSQGRLPEVLTKKQDRQGCPKTSKGSNQNNCNIGNALHHCKKPSRRKEISPLTNTTKTSGGFMKHPRFIVH